MTYFRLTVGFAENDQVEAANTIASHTDVLRLVMRPFPPLRGEPSDRLRGRLQIRLRSQAIVFPGQNYIFLPILDLKYSNV